MEIEERKKTTAREVTQTSFVLPLVAERLGQRSLRKLKDNSIFSKIISPKV